MGESVVHCKKEPYDVYIGRPSKWGNPFEIGKDGTREEVIEKYRQYLNSRPDLLSSWKELEGKILGCWCSPKPCHGDVLVEMILKKCQARDFLLHGFEGAKGSGLSLGVIR